MFWKPITLALTALSLNLCLSAIGAPLIKSACNLKGQCKLIDPMEFMDELGSGTIKLMDENGSELTFAYFHQQVYFVIGDKSLNSEPGSPEERCVLKILKESFAKMYDPGFDKDPGGNGSKRFHEQHAVKHFIRLLEVRCATKPEQK